MLTKKQTKILKLLSDEPDKNSVDAIFYEFHGLPKSGKGYKYSKVTNPLKRLIKLGYLNEVLGKERHRERTLYISKKGKEYLKNEL